MIYETLRWSGINWIPAPRFRGGRLCAWMTLQWMCGVLAAPASLTYRFLLKRTTHLSQERDTIAGEIVALGCDGPRERKLTVMYGRVQNPPPVSVHRAGLEPAHTRPLRSEPYRVITPLDKAHSAPGGINDPLTPDHYPKRSRRRPIMRPCPGYPR